MQFSPPSGYQQILAGEVWNLYRGKYPQVQEHPPLPPSFEIFGLPNAVTMPSQITFFEGGRHDRFWFLRPEGDELIQFQQDRLLHNWRKVGDETNPYPRFESMIDQFRGELNGLQQYVNGLFPQMLAINQCEMSYINHIPLNKAENAKASDWLRFLTFADHDPEGFSVAFGEVFRDHSGNPQGRLICEATLMVRPNGQPIIVFTLTVRGKPIGVDIESALNFMAKGRDLIVCRFAELTTDVAHKLWGRTK